MAPCGCLRELVSARGCRPTFSRSKTPLLSRELPLVCRKHLRSAHTPQRLVSWGHSAQQRTTVTAAAALHAAWPAAAQQHQTDSCRPRRWPSRCFAGQAIWVMALAVLWWISEAAILPGGAFASATRAITGASRESMRHAIRSAYAGLAAGGLHSLAGVDHLAALTPFTIGRSTMGASLLGALWGFGHSTGQMIMGILMTVLKDRFQQLVPALDQFGTATVGVTLVAIGVLGLLEARGQQQEEQLQPVTPAGTTVPADLGTGSGSLLPKQQARNGLRYNVGIFATGVIYGLQPDALFVIVPALTLPTKLAATAYTLMFVFGTVAAMGGYTAVIASASRQLPSSLNSKLASMASSVAVAVGLCILLNGLGVTLPFSLCI